MPSDKIVFPKQDYWERLNDYSKLRVLDALSCLFHMITPCAATVLYKNTLHISYNSQIPNSDAATIFKKYLVINILKQASTIDNLLNVYLILNIDYLDFIKAQERHEQTLEHKEFLKSFIQLHMQIKNTILKKLPKKLPMAEW